MRLLRLLIPAVLCLFAIPAFAQADIERNPGSRSRTEIDPFNVRYGDATPSPPASDYDFSLLTVTLIHSMAKVAAFDFKKAGAAVLGWDENPGGDGPWIEHDGETHVVQAPSDPDGISGGGSGILEFQSGTLYNQKFSPDYQPDDALEPFLPEPEYPVRPEDSPLERQLERLAPRVAGWPVNDGERTAEVGTSPEQIDQTAQALALTESPAAAGGLFVATLPARAPDVLQLPAFPPRMPGQQVPAKVRAVSRGNPKLKQVALTFDDGPHPEYTSQLLAVLGHYDVKATFFFVGVQSQKYPQWVRMAHQAGHEIASQTYDHFRLPKLPRVEKEYQIDEYQRLIEGLVGVTPRFLRPPGGQVDPETEQLLSQRNMLLGMWDVALNDTSEGRTAEEMLQTARSEVRSGSVVLAHDGIAATVEMLPGLIEYLQGQGFELVTMSELAAGL